MCAGWGGEEGRLKYYVHREGWEGGGREGAIHEGIAIARVQSYTYVNTYDITHSTYAQTYTHAYTRHARTQT